VFIGVGVGNGGLRGDGGGASRRQKRPLLLRSRALPAREFTCTKKFFPLSVPRGFRFRGAGVSGIGAVSAAPVSRQSEGVGFRDISAGNAASDARGACA